MKEKPSSKLILTLSIILLIIIAVTFFLIFNKYGIMTGRVTDTGTANITINESASIIFTDDVCNFGGGYVNEIPTFAIVYSNGTVVNGTDWGGCTNGLTVTNIGNVNLTVDLNSTQNASGFIGGSEVRSFKWKAINSTGNNSCIGTSDITDYTEVDFTSPPTICSNLKWASGYNSMQIDFQLTIPKDAVGTKGTVITATGTAVT